MTNPDTDAAILTLSVDRRSETPLNVQLYEQVRDLILSGRLRPESRLPSSRALAADTGVSRTTALAAYDQLVSEGYLEGRRGSGVYVTALSPETLLTTRSAPATKTPAPANKPSVLAKRAARYAASPSPSLSNRPFDAGAPDATAFPFDQWKRLLGRHGHLPHATGREATGGYRPLRQAIADYLKSMRGLVCEADQIVVTSGSHEAVAMLTHVLADPGDRVWVEDPGYDVIHRALAESGANPVTVPVDGEGLSVVAGRAAAPHARFAMVTPSRQFPLGITMSLARRLELLEWAASARAWIVEDDYDSEYRYAGRPLAALMSLDGEGRTIYMGSFSKVMFRGLRLGYVVAPPALAPVLRQAQADLGTQAAMVAQPALVAFMESGQFAAHIRRTRRLYGERQKALLAAIDRELNGLLDASPQEGGMHLIASLTPALAEHMSDREAAALARTAGVNLRALSTFHANTPARQGLLMGYAAWGEEEIIAAAKTLAAALGKKKTPG
jgi:GntR family transcriptional regulator/MocR family aminotransferase